MCMKNTRVMTAATVAVAVAALVVAGCGGGGGGTAANVGHVTGSIVNLVDLTGVRMQVTIAGCSGTSDERQGGAFTVRNIPVGAHEVHVTLTEFFAAVGEIPMVTVTANVTYPMGRILVVDPSYEDPPPGP